MDNDVPFSRIRLIQFGTWDPDVIERMSVAKIHSSETFEDGKPKQGGLFDNRLGPIDKGIPCRTCGYVMEVCPGHFGHIDLAAPVYHPGFIEYVLHVLRCICHCCSRLLIDKKDIKVQKLRQISKQVMGRRDYKFCGGPPLETSEDDDDDEDEAGPSKTKKDKMQVDKTDREGCGAEQRKYTKSGMKILAEVVDSHGVKGKIEITPAKALSILEKISDIDAQYMGFTRWCRPHWLILQKLPVPPPSVRPSVLMDVSRSGVDDLTQKLNDIIKTNNIYLKHEREGSDASVLGSSFCLLRYHVNTYIDNEIPSVEKAQQRSGRELKAIAQRLKGKEGRVRHNLMGKRVDFSARTVITGDPNISIDEVGVPIKIAMNLTFPEVVTEHNKKWLYRLVRNGPFEYPGANRIIKKKQGDFILRHVKDPSITNLELGDIVERHLINGDYVIFNRQPSLHRMSMMGHKAKIMPHNTFRLNLSVTTPYNADFDGDEMNLHLPQDEPSRAEVRDLCMVNKHIISPKSSTPVIGVVQDALLASFLSTAKDIFVDKEFLMNLLMQTVSEFETLLPEPTILWPKELWSGKQLFSLVLPPINLCKKYSDDFKNLKGCSNIGEFADVCKNLYQDQNYFLIKQGQLLVGRPNKKVLGVSGGSITHIIMNDFGDRAAKQFLNQIQKVMNFWLNHHGFSIGLGDTILEGYMKNFTDEHGNRMLIEDYVSLHVFQSAQKEIDQIQETNDTDQKKEEKINKSLNQARTQAARIIKDNIEKNNNIVKMVKGGSKGNDMNISQIIACVGQQNVQGRRPGFEFKGRTLPHFAFGDRGMASCGFVQNSYYKGLTSFEFFYHTKAGREGLVDTAIRTADTGYTSRRLMKAMEDLKVCYDGTVRNSNGDILQFSYGEDNMDPCKIEVQTIEHYILDLEDEPDLVVFRQKYIVDLQPQSEDDLVYFEYEKLLHDNKFLRANFDSSKIDLPVHLTRCIWNVRNKYRLNQNSPIDPTLTPQIVIQKVMDLQNRIIRTLCGNKDVIDERFVNGLTLFSMNLRDKLASKRVIFEYKLTTEILDEILQNIFDRYIESCVEPGEMVGSIAAQSLGEPTQQMTLNTFHFTGIASKNVTLGVPRIQEIINVAKNPKTPSMKIMLRAPHNTDESKKLYFTSNLEYTTLNDVLLDQTQSAICWDPNPHESRNAKDNYFLKLFYSIWISPEDVQHLSPFVIRFELNRAVLYTKGITINSIVRHIKTHLRKDVFICHSDMNAPNLIIRIRIFHYGSDFPINVDECRKRIEELYEKLCDTLLCGIPEMNIKDGPKLKIEKIYVEETNSGENEDEFYLESEGSNLQEMMRFPEIDFAQTTCNNPVEIYNVLGIEAAETAIKNEIQDVFKSYSLNINSRHLGLLGALMTFKGYIMSITRHGINRADRSPLTKCTFEETVKFLVNAARNSEVDPLTSISPNIMIGRIAPMGTGTFDLMIKTEGDTSENNALLQMLKNQDLMQDSIDSKDSEEALPSGLPRIDNEEEEEEEARILPPPQNDDIFGF